jgi:hypothetical protein
VLTDLGLLIRHGGLRTPANNSPLAWLGVCVGPVAVAWLMTAGASRLARDERERRLAAWLPLLFGLALSLVFFALLRERYDYYWAALMPIPSVLAAIALVRIFAVVVARPSALGALGLVVLLLPTRVLAHWGMNYGSEQARAGEQRVLEFRDSAPTPVFDGLTASLFFKPYLVRGELETPVDRMFWAKKRVLSVADEMADAVRAETPEGAPITGSSTIAPLVALLAGRRMAANEVDTNSKTFRTGLRDEREFWQRACDDGVAAVIAGGGFFPMRYMRTPNPVRGQFRLHRRYEDHELRYGRPYRIEVWVLADGRERCTPSNEGSEPNGTL